MENKNVEEKSRKESKKNWSETRNQPPFWSKDLADLRQQARRLYRRARACGDDQLWQCYKEKRTKFRCELRKAKEKSWREFSSGVKSHRDVAKLVKSLQSKQNQEVSLLCRNGTITSPEDMLNQFMEVLLPGSGPLVEETGLDMEEDQEILKNECVSFITMERIKFYIQKFGGKKAPGFDRIRPETLKKLPKNVLRQLVILFKASVMLEYIPSAWKKARAVFIPKPGKENYSQPKSFRPICLSSFIFKILEKMVKEVVERKLMTLPLNKHQHAFRNGRSCDTALSEVVNKWRSTVWNNTVIQTI